VIRSWCALSIGAALVCTTPAQSRTNVPIGTIPLARTSWFWSSTPLEDTESSTPLPNLVSAHNRLEWYNPRGVKERDLDPTLDDAEGGDNDRQVLELTVRPPTGSVSIGPYNWTGLTHALPTSDQDLTRFRFLDLWVNDFAPYPAHTSISAKLHIDLGRVSEDAFWDPDSVPNQRLDSEDKNRDGSLDRSDDLQHDEDTGLDGIHSVNEPGYSPENRDPNGDDYYFDPESVPLDHSGINNMERNGVGDQHAVPDTEDLNRNGFADLGEGYFQVTLDLADTTRFVVEDITRDHGGRTDLDHPVKQNNGWRRYRIPLSDEAFVKVGGASWESIQFIRIWVNGMNRIHAYQIGGIDFLDSLGRATPRTPVVYQNAPNPFNPGTTIRFEMPEPGPVRLRIYDAHGRLVRELVQDSRPAGYHAVFWNGENDSGRRVASGVYWYRVELPGASSQTRKMVLAR
jgi:cell surface protein SprA